MPGHRDHVHVKGAIAVVTGAGSGIGRSIALALARRGAVHVYVADIDPDRTAAVAAEVEDVGCKATGVTLDVTDADAVARLAAQVFDTDGRVDLLFNNAGVGHAGAAADCELADWRRIVEVNIMGVVHGVHAFVPRMLAQGSPAHIVNTASLAGLVPNANMAPYSTSKFAVVGMSESLNLELQPHGIGVTALCPGIINTDIVRTSTVRGEMSARHDNLIKMYATRGTSPDVVAKDALNAAERGKVIAPSPRYQVSPLWMAQRYAPPVSRAIGRLVMRYAGKR